MDGEAWWAPVHGVAQSRTRLKRLSSSSSSSLISSIIWHLNQLFQSRLSAKFQHNLSVQCHTGDLHWVAYPKLGMSIVTLAILPLSSPILSTSENRKSSYIPFLLLSVSILLLGRKVMTNLDSIFKSRDITLPTKVRLVKAMVFPLVMYGCESWTVKKAER